MALMPFIVMMNQVKISPLHVALLHLLAALGVVYDASIREEQV